MVSSNGIEDSSTVERTVKAIRRFGLGADMVIKVDNESSFKKLREFVMDCSQPEQCPRSPRRVSRRATGSSRAA